LGNRAIRREELRKLCRAQGGRRHVTGTTNAIIQKGCREKAEEKNDLSVGKEDHTNYSAILKKVGREASTTAREKKRCRAELALKGKGGPHPRIRRGNLRGVSRKRT